MINTSRDPGSSALRGVAALTHQAKSPVRLAAFVLAVSLTPIPLLRVDRCAYVTVAHRVVPERDGLRAIAIASTETATASARSVGRPTRRAQPLRTWSEQENCQQTANMQRPEKSITHCRLARLGLDPVWVDIKPNAPTPDACLSACHSLTHDGHDAVSSQSVSYRDSHSKQKRVSQSVKAFRSTSDRFDPGQELSRCAGRAGPTHLFVHNPQLARSIHTSGLVG